MTEVKLFCWSWTICIVMESSSHTGVSGDKAWSQVTGFASINFQDNYPVSSVYKQKLNMRQELSVIFSCSWLVKENAWKREGPSISAPLTMIVYYVLLSCSFSYQRVFTVNGAPPSISWSQRGSLSTVSIGLLVSAINIPVSYVKPASQLVLQEDLCFSP